ncbi:MAG: cytochrome P460 family protein, partial [Lysobacterales bacterium]
MRQIVAKLCTRIILLSAVVGASWAHVIFAQMAADEHLQEGLGVAQFTPSDELIFPADTDRWVVLGANIGGDYSDAAFDPKNPGTIGVVQMEPNAYSYLLEHGEYADGTMLLLSFYETQVKPEPELRGFVQGNLSAREIHVIDRMKYQDNRGFYMFSADGGGPSKMLPAGNECVQCHAEHADFDSTFVQFYP